MTEWRRRPVRPIVESTGAPESPSPTLLREESANSPTDRASARKQLDEAYDRGRRDERQSRRSSPVIGLVVLIVVVCGTLLLYLAARNGSFRNGGAVVDNKLSAVEESAASPLRGAADKAGSALEKAGRDLKQKVGDKP